MICNACDDKGIVLMVNPATDRYMDAYCQCDEAEKLRQRPESKGLVSCEQLIADGFISRKKFLYSKRAHIRERVKKMESKGK